MTTIQDIADKLNISKGTVSKALNNAPDISESLQKQILETAVELGYTKLRRYKNARRKLCIIVQKDNIQYKESHQFAYDILMASAGWQNLPVLKWMLFPLIFIHSASLPMTFLCFSTIMPEPLLPDFPWESHG